MADNTTNAANNPHPQNGAGKAKAPAPRKYRVKGRLHHDGKHLKRGSTLSLTPEQAQPLGSAVEPVDDED